MPSTSAAMIRCILAMKSGSVDAFHVVVVCRVTPPARRIRRRVSFDMVATVEQVLTQLRERPGGERGDAPVGGGRPCDQADPLADLLTDRLGSSPFPFWV